MKYGIAAILIDLSLFFLFFIQVIRQGFWFLILYIAEICLSAFWGQQFIRQHKNGAMGCLFLLHHREHPDKQCLSDFFSFILGFALLLPGPLAMLTATILLFPQSRKLIGEKLLAIYERKFPPLIIDQ